MTAFLGLLGETAGMLCALQRRAAYLFAPTLHFSLDGAFALCYAAEEEEEDLGLSLPYLSVGCATGYERGTVTRSNLSFLYRKHGRRLYQHIPCPLAFALYDGKRNLALFGGTKGKKCYLEQTKEGVWFCSDARLLRAPCAVDFAVLEKEK